MLDREGKRVFRGAGSPVLMPVSVRAPRLAVRAQAAPGPRRGQRPLHPNARHFP